MNTTVPFLDLKAMNAEAASEIQAAYQAVLASGEFIGGRFVETFETQWAAYCKTRYCVGLGDGTAALELALRALGAGPGDDVLVPANTFIATWEAIVAVGARPIAVDVDPETLLVTADRLDAAMTGSTVGAIPVHLYGQPADMTSIMAFAQRRGIWIVEDAAQAHGATWAGQMAGSFGSAGCFSFYPGKNLGALGDAGALITNDAKIAEAVRSMANHGRHVSSAHVHERIGSNRRLDGLQAAFLSAKLPYLDTWNERRRASFALYQDMLAKLPLTVTRIARDATSSVHLAVVQVENRSTVREHLQKNGIATGLHYPTPCHLQPAYRHYAQAPMPVVERAAERILSLPMYPHLEAHQIKWVADCLALHFRTAGTPRGPVSYAAE